MKRDHIEIALDLSKRLDAIDTQIERMTNVQENTPMCAVWVYGHSGSELARSDVSREEALAMLKALREDLVARMRDMGVSDAA